MPRKTLFSRSQQHENGKSSTKTKGALETSLPQSKKLTAAVNSWTETALEKANMAVLFDFTGSPKQALDAYNEAIELLDKVFGSATGEYMDQTRLKKIYDSYTERVATLTNQINNNELDLNPSISIPVAQLPQNPLPSPSASTFEGLESLKDPPTPTESSPKHSRHRKPSLNIGTSRADQDLSQSNNPTGSAYSDIKIPAVPPPPVPSKSPKAPAPPPPKSPSRSLFGSMFVKKHNSKDHLKSTSSSASLPFFSMPAPSKSTPTLPMNRSTKSWKKQSSKKKQRHSSELDTLPPLNTSKIDLTSLALPDVEIPSGDDYFDLQSTLETKNLLYSRPEPMLTSLHDLHQKDNGTQNQQEENEHNPPDIIGKINDSATAKKCTSTTRTRSSSSSSSNTTSRYDPPPKSYTSSFMTGNSSVYSPKRSSFYSTTFTYRDEDEYSITSSKYPPSLSLLLPDIDTGNNDSSFFGETSDCAMESLAKLLADSAATMPDRSRRTNGIGAPIAAVIEEPEPELSTSSVLTTSTTTALSTNEFDSAQHQQDIILDRSPSSKSISSSKSRDSMHSNGSSSKRNKSNNGDTTSLSMDSSTPLPSNSSKSISFWNKRNKASSKTKPKTLKTLPPLQMNTADLTSSTTLLSPPGGPNSAPTTPKSIAASIGQAFLSPTATSISSSKRPTAPSAPSTPHHSSFFGMEITATTKNKGIDVDIIMDPCTHNQDNKQPKLMARLLQSMEEGGYVTERIHAPKQLWYQKQVRLPAIDAKISTCEQILGLLHRMHTHTPHFGSTAQQKDVTTEALHDLGRLEHILDQIKQTFGKVTHDLTAPAPPSNPSQHALVASTSYQPASTPQDYPNQPLHSKSRTDPMTLWGNKLSKSVERMRIEAKSSEEQVHAYISTLIRLFSMASVLDEWRDRLMELSGSIPMTQAYIYDHMLQKTIVCASTFHTLIVGGFVMRDFAILLNKWLKRCREWTLDD